ncbi:hypothetical protein UA08_07322 [Talaromyces atroroseus]|uniref:Uncharacterized protein n=1 Tax=Talaromyces atroroseus TaxID=1441469 RepID=A0A225A9H4_TALAT|nr:hypothetical protein UA08_07322 [Talaromyces atroroseus]OKL57402.1 hypothetical protein UA08_07322 [Talaromyces atroroseus]
MTRKDGSDEYIFLNYSVVDFENEQLPPTLDCNVDQVEEPNSPIEDENITQLSLASEQRHFDTDTSLQLFSGISDSIYQGTHSHLLNYYITELCPKCSLSTTYNPYLQILLPIAVEFAPLRNALLAAAANQLRLQHDDRFKTHAFNLKSAAMNGLRHQLSLEGMDWKSLATTLMLCFFDISDGCAPSWITHLNIGLHMLEELKVTTLSEADLKAFCQIYFVAHEVMGRTAWDAETTTGDYRWACGNSAEIDALMGCSRELLSIISQISSLAAQFRSNGDQDFASHLAIRRVLVQRLRQLDQYSPAGTQNSAHLLQVAEAKRLAAMLYLEERIPVPEQSSTINIRSMGRKRLIDSIIDILRVLPATSAASLWPLFVLGNSQLENEGHRHFVLGRLAQLERSRKLGNIYHARRLVERKIIARTLSPIEPQRLWHLPRGVLRNENERWGSTTGYSLDYVKFVGFNNVERCQILLGQFCDRTLTDQEFMASVHTPRITVEAGADIDARDCWGRTSLRIAVGFTSTSLDFIEILLEKGADVNARDIYDQTPLLKSIRGDPCTTQLLLKHKPSTEVRDIYDNTPLSELHPRCRAREGPINILDLTPWYGGIEIMEALKGSEQHLCLSPQLIDDFMQHREFRQTNGLSAGEEDYKAFVHLLSTTKYSCEEGRYSYDEKGDDGEEGDVFADAKE